jgi:hypothetical protein
MNDSIAECLIKDGNYFYMDLEKWAFVSDIKIEINDDFNFFYNKKKYFVKVIDILNGEATLKIK